MLNKQPWRERKGGPQPAPHCPPAPNPGQPWSRDFLSSPALTHTIPSPNMVPHPLPPGHPAQAPECNVIPPRLLHTWATWAWNGGVSLSGSRSLLLASQRWTRRFHLLHRFISCRGNFDPNRLCLQGNKKEKNSADIHISGQGGTSSLTAKSHSICLGSGS